VKRLFVDSIIVLGSVVVAIAIVNTNAVALLLEATGGSFLTASFIAGLFFTSVFTTAPAIVFLGELAQEGNLLMVALVGALGAVLGDYLLFAFVRDRVSEDAAFLLKGPRFKRVVRVFKRRHFRRVLPILGALIIASPFPDELGLALLGISKMNTRSFFVLSYAMNAGGIIVIGLVARAFVG